MKSWLKIALVFLVLVFLLPAAGAVPRETAKVCGFNSASDFASWSVIASPGSSAHIAQVSTPRTEGTSSAKLEANFASSPGWAEWDLKIEEPIALDTAKVIEFDFYPAEIAGELHLQLKQNGVSVLSFPLTGLQKGKWNVVQIDVAEIKRTMPDFGGMAIANYKTESSPGQTLFYLDYVRVIPFPPEEMGIGYSFDLSGQWQFAYDVDEVGIKEGWQRSNFNDFNWQPITVPGYWETQGFTLQVPGRSTNLPYNGVAWYRKRIFIPKSWEDKEVVLYLGQIDDEDITFFNGTQIGETKGWRFTRVYPVDKSLIRFGGENVIAVRVNDLSVGGGIFAGPVKLEAEGSGDESPLKIRSW